MAVATGVRGRKGGAFAPGGGYASISGGAETQIGLTQSPSGNCQSPPSGISIPSKDSGRNKASARFGDDFHDEVGAARCDRDGISLGRRVGRPEEPEIGQHAAPLGDANLEACLAGECLCREILPQHPSDVLVHLRRHVDREELAIDELAQVVPLQADEVVPGVGAVGGLGLGHERSMGHGGHDGTKRRVSRGCPVMECGCPATGHSWRRLGAEGRGVAPSHESVS
jgi:hypothetical protein